MHYLEMCMYIYIYMHMSWPARSWLKTWALGGGAVHGRCWKMKWCWKKMWGKCGVQNKKMVFGPGV